MHEIVSWLAGWVVYLAGRVCCTRVFPLSLSSVFDIWQHQLVAPVYIARNAVRLLLWSRIRRCQRVTAVNTMSLLAPPLLTNRCLLFSKCPHKCTQTERNRTGTRDRTTRWYRPKSKEFWSTAVFFIRALIFRAFAFANNCRRKYNPPTSLNHG